MDIRVVVHIARNGCRIITRSGLYRFSLLFIFAVVFSIQYYLQGDVGEHGLAGLSTMPSFIPYVNQFLYTIIQIFFLFFLIGYFLGQERKLDSMAAIYYRPESNRELLLGYFLAFGICFVMGACVACILGMVIHLFCSAAPFAFMPYLFYVFTLSIPAFVFYAGLAFLVFVVVKVQFLALLFVTGCFVLNLLYADRVACGVFDPLGIYLPNTFSNLTGHPDLFPYLVQRLCWSCLGVGCLGLAVVSFRRIPNRLSFLLRVILPVVFLVSGVGLGFSFYRGDQSDEMMREAYRSAYIRYAGNDCLTMVRQEIDFHREEDRVCCESVLTLKNETGRKVQEILLFLNPGLEVQSVKVEGREVDFERDCQVVRVKREVVPADSVEIAMAYAGGIDERICYLDVADRTYREVGGMRFLVCKFGKHNVFLDKNYTLLLPECLWYPVAMPPVNLLSPYEMIFPFASFRLSVSGHGDQEVIAQGKRMKKEGKEIFIPAYPTQGISLCIGDYVTASKTVDGVRYDFYVFRKNSDIVQGLGNVAKLLPRTIRELRKRAEKQMRRPYPYNRFALVETPLSFTSYNRFQRGGSEFVQPEMLFFPERGVGFWKNVLWQKKNGDENKKRELLPGLGFKEKVESKGLSPGEHENAIVKNFLESFLFEKHAGRKGISLGLQYKLGVSSKQIVAEKEEWNDYILSAMFKERLCQVYSREMPWVNMVLHNVINVEGERSMRMTGDRGKFDKKAIAYLASHSFVESLNDTCLPVEIREQIISMKTEELFKRFSNRGIRPQVLYAFVDSCMKQSAFRLVDFDTLNKEFRNQNGMGLDTVLLPWSLQCSLPTYLVKQFKVASIEKERVEVKVDADFSLDDVYRKMKAKSKFRVYLEVYNDSDVDGWITLVDRELDLYDRSYYSGSLLRYEDIELKAREGKIIVWEYNSFDPRLELGLSCNIPREFRSGFMEKVTNQVENSVRYANRAYFTGEDNPREIIVDNEDAGFHVKEKSPFFLQNLFRKKKKEREYEESFFLPSERVWKYCAGFEDYGTPIGSSVYKLAGEGELFASWESRVSVKGEYEIYAYVVHQTEKGNKKSQERTFEEKRKLLYPQYYTVRNGGKEYDVKVETRDMMPTFSRSGPWRLLGKFPLEPGPVEVVLWDKGEEVDQVIVADAVKFVLVEE